MAPPSLHELCLPDDPGAWRDAGFAVDDDGRCRMGTTSVALGAAGTGWCLRGIPAVDDLDGIATSTTTDDPVDPADHPNGTVGIDHIVLVSPDLDRTTAAFEALGVALRRTRDIGTPASPMQQRFFRLGPVIVELVGPATPDGSDRPARFYGLALDVADLDATVASYRPGGSEIGAAKDAVQPGRRIATLRHTTFGLSLPVAFMSPDVAPHL